MGRLTEKNEQGYWWLKDVPWESLAEGAVITREIREKLYGALCKLKDYEDTGLTPEDVVRVNDFEQSQAGILLKKLSEEQRKHRWIPVIEKHFPEAEKYVLLSFENFSLPIIGRYERDEDGGGVWYLGDCDEQDTCLANDLFVNAWMPLPARYEEEIINEPTAKEETGTEISDKITAHVKDALAAGGKIKKESDPVINTARILAGRRKKCSISKWVLHKR